MQPRARWHVDSEARDQLKGYRAQAVVALEADAEEWLHMKARELYPDSDYPKATRPN